MADKSDKYVEMLNPDAATEALGWTDRGFKRLNTGLQEQAFNKAADILGSQHGKDANETAGNIVSQVTEPLGHSVAADILRTALQTGATVGLNPSNLVTPGGPKMLGGTVHNAEINVAKQVAKDALETGSMDTVNQIANTSRENLINIIPRHKPSGLDVLQGTQLPVAARGQKWVQGANEILLPNVRPTSPTGVKYIPATNQLESGLAKFDAGKPSTVIGTSMKDKSGKIWTMQELAAALQKKGLR